MTPHQETMLQETRDSVLRMESRVDSIPHLERRIRSLEFWRVFILGGAFVIGFFAPSVAEAIVQKVVH